MLLAALLSLLIAALLLVAGLLSRPEVITLELGPLGNLDINSTAMYFLGMATLLFFVLSVILFRAAGRRASARRRDRKKVGELSAKLEQFQRDKHDERDTPATRE